VKYTLWLDGSRLGSSDLEHLDDGVGVIFGRFFPEPGYKQVEAFFRALVELGDGRPTTPVARAKLARFYAQRDALGLSLRRASGEEIATEAITVRDYRPEGGDDSVELEVVLSAPLERSRWDDRG